MDARNGCWVAWCCKMYGQYEVCLAGAVVSRPNTRLALLAVVACQLAAAPTPIAQQGLLGDLPIFESSLHPDSRVSEIGRLGDAMFLGVGQFVFVDGASQQLIFVDVETGAVGIAGRKGDGPREFRSARLLTRLPDGEVVVWDDGHRRFRVATGDGMMTDGATYEESMLMNPLARPVALYSDGASVFRDGTLSSEDPVMAMRRRMSRAGDRYRDTVQYRMLHPDGSTGVVAEALGPEMFGSASGTRRITGPVVFGHTLLESQVGQHLAVGQTDLGSIRIFDRFGELVTEIPMPQGVTVSSEQIAAERERLARSLVEPGFSPRMREYFPGRDTDDFLSAFGEHFRTTPTNGTAPPVDRMLGDWGGRLWLCLARPGEATEHWQVWDISGPKLVSTLTLPEGQRLLDSAGSRVLIHTRDEFGVDYLLVREMTNGSAGGR